MVTLETEFERAIVDFCKELGEMLIKKNRLYGDSFRNIRIDANKELHNPRIPLWLHMKEKLNRYMENNQADTEDVVKDAAGYWILEAICSEFDDRTQEKV